VIHIETRMGGVAAAGLGIPTPGSMPVPGSMPAPHACATGSTLRTVQQIGRVGRRALRADGIRRAVRNMSGEQGQARRRRTVAKPVCCSPGNGREFALRDPCRGRAAWHPSARRRRPASRRSRRPRSVPAFLRFAPALRALAGPRLH